MKDRDGHRRVLVVGSLARADGMRPFCVNNMPFFSSLFFYTLRRNPKYIQGRPERKIPAVWDPLFTLGTKTEKIEEGILFYDPLRAVFDVP